MKLTRKIAFALIPSIAIAPGVYAAQPVMIALGTATGFNYMDADELLQEGTVRSLTASEFGALAVSLAEKGKPDAAMVAVKLGLGAARNNREKAALQATLALIWGSQKDFAKAADAAQRGQEYLPNDPRLAALRVIYYEQAGDGVEALAAKSHLMHLDPNFNRTPVFSVQDAMVMLKTVTEIYVAVKVAWENISPETKQDIRDMLGKIWHGAQFAEEKIQEEAQSIEN